MVVCPGGGLAVRGVGLEAAVEDADESVAELAQCGLVADPAITQGSVVGAGTGRASQRAERPLVYGVAEAAVPGVAGDHDTAVTGSAGDWGGAGVVLTGFGVGEAMEVVAELGLRAPPRGRGGSGSA